MQKKEINSAITLPLYRIPHSHQTLYDCTSVSFYVIFCSSYVVERRSADDYRMYMIQDETTPLPVQITASSTVPIDKTNIQAITGTNTQTPNRLISTNRSYAAVALGYPELQVQLYKWYIKCICVNVNICVYVYISGI